MSDRVREVILDTLEAVSLTLLEHGYSPRDLQELMDQAQLLAFREFEKRVAQIEEGH